MVRLLKLPEEVQHEVSSGRLSMGHARALLALDGDSAQRQLGRDIIARGLSVRETEALVKKALEAPQSAERRAPAPQPQTDANTRQAEETLKLQLGTAVRIVRRGTKGRIEIDFTSEEELIRIYDALTDK
jgi:ParB family chromosome partitioning protein